MTRTSATAHAHLLFFTIAAVLAGLAGASPEEGGGSPLSADWFFLSPDSLAKRPAAEWTEFISLCQEMGWAEREYALRKAGLEYTYRRSGSMETERRRLGELAVRTGRNLAAFEIFSEHWKEDPVAAAAAGVAAIRIGRREEAVGLLRSALRRGVPDEEVVLFRLAEAMEEMEEEEHGIPLLVDLSTRQGSRYQRPALYEAALRLLDSGRTEEALDLLQAEFGEGYDDLAHRELIFRVARAEAEGGDPRKAARLWKHLLERWPDHGRALESFRLLRLLESEEKVPRDERLPLLGARAASQSGRLEEAIQLLRPFADRDPDDPLRLEATLEMGKVFYGGERYHSALKQFDQLDRRGGEVGRLALLYQARSYRKMGEWERSIDAYSDYVRRFPTSSLSPEVQWEIAWRWSLLGETEKSVDAFRRLRALFPSSRFAARSYLQEAVRLDRTGEPLRALELLRGFTDHGGGGSDREDALFRIADLCERLADQGDPTPYYEELVDEYPETYHGLRAAARLGKKPILSTGTSGGFAEDGDATLLWIRSWSGGGGGPEDWGTLPFLISMGEWDDARGEAARIRRRLDDDPEALLRFARYCRRVTLYDHTIRCGRRIQELAERAGADPVYPGLLSLIYPLGFFDHVATEASRRPELDPFFVAAVMRQESWFHPQALSPAGARGLLQIIPATGRHIASKLGEGERFRTEDLFLPEKSVRYGIWYLRSLIQRYGGSLLAAASAYNAGEGNADLWVSLAGGAEDELYIEQINLSETREYVMRTLAGYWIYRSLYEEIGAALSLG